MDMSKSPYPSTDGGSVNVTLGLKLLLVRLDEGYKEGEEQNSLIINNHKKSALPPFPAPSLPTFPSHLEDFHHLR